MLEQYDSVNLLAAAIKLITGEKKDVNIELTPEDPIRAKKRRPDVRSNGRRFSGSGYGGNRGASGTGGSNSGAPRGRSGSGSYSNNRGGSSSREGYKPRGEGAPRSYEGRSNESRRPKDDFVNP